VALSNVVILAGGVGGAKLAHGLAQLLPADRLTIIVNTGDDLWRYGLRVCPDLDTVTYTLADIVDKGKGWGIAGDSTHMLSAMQRLGETPWFGLGDQDTATHLLRTQMWHAGLRLTEITLSLTKRLGISHTILPMTDAPVRTMINTKEQGELEFQDYFVRCRWQPTVTGIRFDGMAAASVSPEARAAVEQADAILIGPSNPWLSIDPILAVPGMRELILSRDIPRVAVSPIVQGQAVKGPAAKLMAELNYEASALAVADYYGAIINGFVYDARDAGLNLNLKRAVTFDTMMLTDEDRVVLSRKIMQWIEEWA
jgi:LPPG:FO 2-phospho-L-lactate transferase